MPVVRRQVRPQRRRKLGGRDVRLPLRGRRREDGHFIVGHAVLGNICPFPRSSKEDHEIDASGPALRIESKWHVGCGPDAKQPSLKQGYDAHYVCVKKTDPKGPKANYAVWPNAEVHGKVCIADELLFLADCSDQLLPEYLLRFEVCRR